MTAVLLRTPLQRHPAALGPSITSVRAQVSRDGGHFKVVFEFSGALEQLAFPEGRLDPARLWEHTCAELFLGCADGSYVEWNFSPTGQTTRFGFAEYRVRTSSSFEEPVQISVARDGRLARLEATGPLLHGVGDARCLGLCAVVRTPDDACSYWALRHPKAEPDFHDERGFLLNAALLHS